MCCLHRFLNYHQPGLFPNWPVNYLIIGTFNPSWNNPNGNNADYFYGRSAYFWHVLPRFRGMPSLQNSSVQQKVSFCQNQLIGLTDLITEVSNADHNNAQHRDWILSFKDADLLNFGAGLVFNTQNIIQYINNNPGIERVYFTLLGSSAPAIDQQITLIEQHCDLLRNVHQRNIGTHRLHTPTGSGLRKGIPRENKLTHRWHQQGLSHIIPPGGGFNLGSYPYQPFP